jgi:hypothetical protein
MPKPAVGSNLVTYDAPPVSVDDEATRLSRDTLVWLIEHMEEILKGDKSYEEQQVWKSYRGVPLFRAEINGELMVYAVEHEAGRPLPECKISVMFAGTRNMGHTEGAMHWNGTDDEKLWTGIVQPRCAQHFT